MPRVITPGCKVLYVEIKEALWTKLKIKAVREQKTLREVITKLIEKATR